MDSCAASGIFGRIDFGLAGKNLGLAANPKTWIYQADGIGRRFIILCDVMDSSTDHSVRNLKTADYTGHGVRVVRLENIGYTAIRWLA
jgi:hypothetical protein